MKPTNKQTINQACDFILTGHVVGLGGGLAGAHTGDQTEIEEF